MDFDTLLIEKVKSFDFLWDKTNKDYRNASKKYAAWENIARSVGQSAQKCKTRWKNMRDTFVRNCADGGSNADASHTDTKWKYFDSMLFIRDSITRRRTENGCVAGSLSDFEEADKNGCAAAISVSDFGDEEKNDAVDDAADLSPYPSPSSTPAISTGRSTPSTTTVSKAVEKPSKRKRDDSSVEDSFLGLLWNKAVSKAETEDELYGRSLGITLGRYPAIIKSEIKVKIQQALLDADKKLEIRARLRSFEKNEKFKI